jgi:hypothetical protein
MIESWLPAIIKDKERKLLWAASDIIESRQIPLCPLCHQSPIRFYYRDFGIVQISKRRGTIWVWCNECGLWDHISGVGPGDDFVYDDPLGASDFTKIDTAFLIPRLNELWERGLLPHTVWSQ